MARAGNDLLRCGTLGGAFIFELNHGHDKVSGIEWLDQIRLSTILTAGRRNPTEIVNTYARSLEGEVVLWLAGGDKIIFASGVTEADLIDTIYTF